MKVATTLRIDINRITEQALKEEKHRTPKQEMEGPASPRGLKNRHCALPFIVHDDNDDFFLQSSCFFNPMMAKSRCSRYFCQSVVNSVSR